MTAGQAREAFRRTFAPNAPAALGGLDLLTPGDFTLVARKSKLLGVSEGDDLVAMLTEEVAAKGGARGRIGF